jgi:hypothetical protein
MVIDIGKQVGRIFDPTRILQECGSPSLKDVRFLFSQGFPGPGEQKFPEQGWYRYRCSEWKCSVRNKLFSLRYESSCGALLWPVSVTAALAVMSGRKAVFSRNSLTDFPTLPKISLPK